MRETHGGDWAGFQAQYGALPLDFSASVSPLGLPQGVKQAVTDALEGASRYPDPLCRRLRAGLARAHGVPPRAILCGSLSVPVAGACRNRYLAVSNQCAEIRRVSGPVGDFPDIAASDKKAALAIRRGQPNIAVREYKHQVAPPIPSQ